MRATALLLVCLGCGSPRAPEEDASVPAPLIPGNSQPDCGAVAACIRKALPDPFDPARDRAAIARAEACLGDSLFFEGCFPIALGKHARDGRSLTARVPPGHDCTPTPRTFVLTYTDVDEATCRCLGESFHDAGFPYCRVVDHDAARAERAAEVRAGTFAMVDGLALIGPLPPLSPLNELEVLSTAPAGGPLDLGTVELHKPIPGPLSHAPSTRLPSTGQIRVAYRSVSDAQLRTLLPARELQRFRGACRELGSADTDAQGAVLDGDLGDGRFQLEVAHGCAALLPPLERLYKKLEALPKRHRCGPPVDVPYGGATCMPDAGPAAYLGVRIGTRELRVFGAARSKVVCTDLTHHLGRVQTDDREASGSRSGEEAP